MSSLLRRDVTGRGLLAEVFGGDCCRISCLRSQLESRTLSQASCQDQRLSMCMLTCESVEKVLEDLGLGEALRQALSVEKEARARHAEIMAAEVRADIVASSPEKIPLSSPVCT